MPAYTAVNPYDPERGRPVHEEISGLCVVPMTTLARLLGKSAMALWRAMVLCRSESGGVYHGTTERMAPRVELTPRNVKRAMARLRAAKLVRDDGWRKLRVHRGGRVVEMKVYSRTVYGAVIDRAGTRAFVPADVSTWLETAHGHGGDRRSRGYARGQDGAQRDETCTRSARDTLENRAVSALPDGARNVQASMSRVQTTTPVQSVQEPIKCVPSQPAHFSSVSPDKRGREDIGPFLTFSSKKLPVASDPEPGYVFDLDDATTSDQAPHADAPLREHDVDIGRCRLGRARDASPPIAVGGPLPPYPGQSLIAPAETPKPPPVDASASPEDQAMQLVRAYNGACASRLGKPSRTLCSHRALTGSRYFANLCKTAKLLAEKKISPGAWAAWWLDWHKSRGRTDKPPLQVVFGLKTVGDHVKRAMFRKSGKHYGGRVVYGERHLELLHRYEAMRQHIRTLAITTEVELAAVVAEHFPPGEWGLLVNDAQNEATALQVHYSTALQANEFLW